MYGQSPCTLINESVRRIFCETKISCILGLYSVIINLYFPLSACISGEKSAQIRMKKKIIHIKGDEIEQIV